jgi:uncharacterized membrane protein
MGVFMSQAFIKTASLSAVIFIILDLLWLAVIASPFYLKHFGHLATVENGKIVFNLYAGILAQVVIALAIVSVITLALNTQNTLLTSVIAGPLQVSRYTLLMILPTFLLSKGTGSLCQC